MLRKVKKKWICIIPEKIMKLQNDKDWYKQIALSNIECKIRCKTYRIHRLVALHFIPNPEEKPIPNHKDWNKQNNYVENLEWATYSENELHSYNVLWKKPNKAWLWIRWDNNPSSKKILQYKLDWTPIKIRWSIVCAEEKLWISNISACCCWKQKTAWGYIRKYFI